MSRFARLVLLWLALLIVGFAAVFTLGAPLPTDAQVLDAAMHPVPPVSEEAARTAASTIVRLEYRQFDGVAPTVERRIDFGIEYWTIGYSSPPGSAPSGLNISIGINSGKVTVVTSP